MGHIIFIILHLVAVLFAGIYLLFLTIPAHLIYIAVASKSGSKDKS